MEYLNSANYTYPKIMSWISATISHWNKYTFLKTNHVYITILFLLQYIVSRQSSVSVIPCFSLIQYYQNVGGIVIYEQRGKGQALV